jgi:hypothetical protein
MNDTRLETLVNQFAEKLARDCHSEEEFQMTLKKVIQVLQENVDAPVS